MGANSSQIHDVFSQILSEEPMNTLLSDEIYKLSYEQFLSSLEELNLLSKKFMDSNGHQLVFAVKSDTDSTFLWKATIQIACGQFDPVTQQVSTFRLLTLGEFLKVLKTLKCQYLAVEHCESASSAPDISISNIFDDMNLDSLEHSQECCICFERKQEVSLPCAHSYCLPCIEEWNETHDTCPICRDKLDSTDDTWVISEVPKAEEISKEIRQNLLELTNDKREPCNPS